MSRAIYYLLLLALLWCRSTLAYGVSDAHDLAADGRQAAESKTPIVVMFSADHCPYCEQVRRDYIDPLPDHPRFGRRVMVRIVTTDSDFTLTDFNGVETTHTHFARDQGVALVPTVRFYGVNGERLAPDLVGAMLPDFYLDYLEGAIKQAARKLGQATMSRH